MAGEHRLNLARKREFYVFESERRRPGWLLVSNKKKKKIHNPKPDAFSIHASPSSSLEGKVRAWPCREETRCRNESGVCVCMMSVLFLFPFFCCSSRAKLHRATEEQFHCRRLCGPHHKDLILLASAVGQGEKWPSCWRGTRR